MCKLTKEFVNFAGLECSNDKWLGKEKKYVFSSKATRRAIATYAVYDGTHHDMSYYSKKMFGKLYLKKKSGAYYGYVATKMVLARTNEEFR
ncbi:hypothetical protein SAMN02910358_02003 [Lachnospiraceae bacterium XBB1006]|nr:hypothetical protein SAMN02910358_02003 [Lachnospiraceae bacterium XBB1006]